MLRDSIRQQTVVAQVMDEIRNLIASGAYAPGDRIPTEKELAERFGIGRSSIREAIKIFNYLGVLRSKAALGTFVQERSSISSEALTWAMLLGRDELQDIIDMRGAVELMSLIKLIDSLRRGRPEGSEAASALEGILDAMDRASREDNRDQLKEQDYSFHYLIIKSSLNPLFIAIYETLRSFLEDEIGRSQDDYDNPRQIYLEHRQILDAVLEAAAKGGTEELVSVYTGHIENIKRRLEHSKAAQGSAEG